MDFFVKNRGRLICRLYDSNFVSLSQSDKQTVFQWTRESGVRRRNGTLQSEIL